MSRKQLVFPLAGNQAAAVEPGDSVWLSASAGTGKTQVLSARVLRLLLQEGCDPESLLCLTFTKAGAAEMATRVNDVLASWVRMGDGDLAADLKAIGAPVDGATRERARTLFAKVLDCPGGGLRIDTIHAFSQWLLAAFPEEAGLVPGTRAMEDRERELLAREVLSDLLLAADSDDLDALAMLSIRHGPDGAKSWLMRCADALDLWTGTDGWQPPMRDRVHRVLGLPAGYGESDVAALCGDDAFATQALGHCIATLEDWGTKGALETVSALRAWMDGDDKARLAGIGVFNGTLFTADAEKPKNLHHIAKRDAAYEAQALAVLDAVQQVQEKMGLLALAEYLVPALTLGRKFALAWDERKKRDGLIDFDDQIRRASHLLANSALSDWIRYKLDRQFDHILVDEAQDTNQAQWDIIRALTGDFFTGIGQRDDTLRTVFVVGDYKQAIFGFQGTSPQNFAAQKEIYRREIDAAIANAEALARETRSKPVVQLQPLRDLGLDRSFRTAQPVLDFVDHAIAAIGHEEIGLDRQADRHEGDTRPGYVALWEPVVAGAEQEPEPSEDGWLPGPERAMADRIADQVRHWLDSGHPLAKGRKRNAGPGDIMVLVRKRRELAGLIVARLHARGVPVAGVDRLRLGAPLVVKDLMAALRFAAQPLDDLSLAGLLVSPLGGWSQEDLLEHGYRPDKTALWDHLRKNDHPFVAETVHRLRALLERVDYEPPEALLYWMLTGPWQGRRKLVARLGREANDPIDELVNAAMAFSATDTASLQGFIRWFDVGEGELKRDAGGDDGLVRVMTVHGSKGLQAPIVILADATGNPDASRTGGLAIEEDATGKTVPIPALPKDQRYGPVAEAEEAAKQAEREEHWRLLYVAMTRAEEALYIGGALGQRELRNGPADDSWYARLAPLFDDEVMHDPIWGGRRARGALPADPAEEGRDAEGRTIALPAWARTPIGPEPRPPRPLAPSGAGEEQGADPPLPPHIAASAARRGVLMHSLLERLPAVEAGEREERATAWLTLHGADLAEEERREMLDLVLAVLRQPDFAPIFAPAALAEVPLAAIVGGQVVAGIADRLLVTDEEVIVVDFKTARRPPRTADAIPQAIVKQMAAYVSALETIFPGKRVRAGVLYTQTPQLFAIPAERLALHKAELQD